MHPSRARSLLWATLVLASCAAAPSGPPKDSTPTGESEPAGKRKDGPSAAEAPAGPKKPSCADGSCFECGEGICPVGYYCESSHGAPAACGWSPACAQKATCACLEPSAKGCRCEEKNGAPLVTCP
jgi:hypothetical protein